MDIFWLLALVFLALFSFVIVFGAPYVPILARQQKEALDLLGLKPGQKMYDLGSGDGRVLRSAAKRGWYAVGYELNPLLFAISWLRIYPCRKLAGVQLKNFWRADISEADGIFVFLIEHKMARLDEYLTAKLIKKPVKVVSYGFAIPGRRPIKKQGALYLYRYGNVARRR